MPLKDTHRHNVPEWLGKLDLSGQNPLGRVDFSLRDLLERSLYYPACGLDGRPVQFLAGFVHSFIYADYGISSDRALGAFRDEGFKGYRLAARRGVKQNELVPAGWLPRVEPRFTHELHNLAGLPRGIVQEYFAEWMIFERIHGFGEDHGPYRFSILYICEEGVTMYQAMYIRRRIAPLILAVIQPGTGFGGNFTDFRDPDGFLADTVLRMGAPALPSYMVCGGLLLDYDNAFWERAYPRLIEYFQHPRGNGIWGRPDIVI